MRYSASLFIIILLSGCGGGSSSAPDPNPQILETYDQNDPPNISDPGPISVLEGTTSIHNFSALDPENEQVSLTISGGKDASVFTLSENGTLSFTANPDYENPLDSDSDNIYELILQASDGSETSSLSVTVTVSDAIEGRIVDGPLRNGKVFLDLNGNSKQDLDEPSGSTDENGFFTISYVQSAKDAVLANLYTARVIAVGGQDTFTEQDLPDFSVISDLPFDTTQFVYVTPITTVVAAAKTIAAKAQVLISLDIDLTFQNLLTTPIWRLAEGGDETAKNIQRESLQVAVVLQSETKIDGLSPAELVNQLATTMAEAANKTPAKEQITVSNEKFDLATDSVNDGSEFTLSFNLGTNDPVNQVIQIDETSIEGIVSAINIANLGITATAVNNLDESGLFQIQLNGQTGAGNSFTATSSDGSLTFTTTQSAIDGDDTTLDLTKSQVVCEVLKLDPSFDQSEKAAVCESVAEMNSILDSDEFDPVSETAKQVAQKAQGELQENIDNLEDDKISSEEFTKQTDLEKLFEDVSVPEDENTTDTDNDGRADVLELDDDGDGLKDTEDGFPKASITGLPDNDKDGVPDQCDAICLESGMIADSDDDNDGVPDESDAYPLTSVADYPDLDRDGRPDDCDAQCESRTGMKADMDDDNDGYEEREPMRILTPVVGTDGNSVSIPFATANGEVSLRFLVGPSGWLHDPNEDTSVWIAQGLYLEEAIDEVLLQLKVNTQVTTPDEFVAFFAVQATLFVGGDRFPGSASQTFDTDGDGIPNNEDFDLDGDGLPNDCDEECIAQGGSADDDDDNDGFDDLSEIAQNTNPRYEREYPSSGGYLNMGASFMAGHELDGLVKVPVRRFFSSRGAVTVNYKTVDGFTGKAEEHYQEAKGSLSWDDGDFSEKFIEVRLKDNGTSEKYTFSVVLENPTRGALIGSWKTVIYVDGTASQFRGLTNYVGSISPVAWGNLFEESSTTEYIEIKRWAGAEGALSINYSVEGCDLIWNYTVARSGVVSWSPGEVGPKQIPVKIVPDSFANHQADACSGKINFSNPSDASAYVDRDLTASNNGIDFTFLNDDIAGGGIIQYAQIDTATEEEAGSVEVRFIRRGPTGGTLSINARTENGARFRIPGNSLDGGGVGLDYKAASVTHNWSSTDMQPVSINVPLIDDLLADKDHAFGVAFDWYSRYTCGVDEETEGPIVCDSAGSSRAGVFIYDYFDDNKDIKDLDGDRIRNYADNDVDGDGVYNWVDTDDDGDGFADTEDSHPYSKFENLDTDLNGIGNNDDPDNDGDGILDQNDMYPLISLGMLLDSNLDGQPNDCDIFCLNGKMTADPDDDGDSVPDQDDATPLLAGTPCAEYYVSNVRRFGVTDGTDCYYDLDFAQEGNPILQDLYFAALPSQGAHKFAGSLVMGKAYSSDADLIADGIFESGDGPSITIEAGANLAFAHSGVSLIINRGARIIAEGNQQDPITLTSYGDTKKTTTSEQAGQWGGLIINGFAVTNQCEYIGSRTFNDSGSRDSDTLSSSKECHALSPIRSLQEKGKVYYGGDNNLDNSGVLSYVVVKHAGGLASATPAAITLNSVGQRTKINHIQVYSSLGDGIALVGGTVDVENISMVYSRDDSLQIDEGYAGQIQFGLFVQPQYNGNHCVEVHGIGSYLTRSTETIEDIINRGLNSRPRMSNLTCIFSPNGVPDNADPLNPEKQGTYGPGAGYILKEGTYPQLIDSLTIGSFGAAIDTANYGLRIDDVHTVPGFLNGFSRVQTSMFAVEFDEPDDDFQTAGVGDEDNPNPDGIGDNDELAQFKLGGLSIKDWLTANGGNVFAEVAEGGADASSEGDAALVLLEGAPPIYSVDGALSEPTITMTNSAYPGGLNLGEVDWATGWSFGLYPDNRAKAAWFDIVGIDTDPEADTDTDGDGVVDLLDSFPAAAAERLDTDGDGVGNNADADDDGDGVNDNKDAYQLITLAGLDDLDGDGRPNNCSSACVSFGMNADSDDDGDGIADADDPFPLFNANLLTDTDSDGRPDTCNAQCVAAGVTADPDDDNDGILDVNDPFPLINLPSLIDTDGDGLPNVCNPQCIGAGLTEDLDDDDDNIPDISDALPLVSVSGYADQDKDGLPNTCNASCLGVGLVADTDDDGDGVADTIDPFPLISVTGFPDEDNNGYPDVCNAVCLATGMTVEPGGPWSLVGDFIQGRSRFDNFGESVAISADGAVVAIGAPGYDLSANQQDYDAGQVQVWKWNGNSWSSRGQFLTGLAGYDKRGWSISLSANGNRLAIGAPYHNNRGRVTVLDWNNNAQVYEQIYAREGGVGTNSGYAVALSANGSRLAIGEPSAANTNGAVLVLDLSDLSDVRQLGITINGDNDGGESGLALSLKNNGNTLAIGDPKYDGANTPDNGHVRVFDLQTQGTLKVWIQRGNDIEGSVAGDLSGTSLDLSDNGNILAIGSPSNDSGGNNSGHVRIFEWINNNWITKGNPILGTGNRAGEQLGSQRSISLSADGTILATGARFFNSNRGRVSIYKYKGAISGWQQRGNDLLPQNEGDQGGAALDLSDDGKTIVVSAPRFDGTNGTDSGSVGVYDW